MNKIYHLELSNKKSDSVAEEEMIKGLASRIKNKSDIDDTDIIDMAAEVFFKRAITQAVDNTFYNLQSLLGIDDGGFCPSMALHVNEHLETLVKDYCDILNSQKLNI